MLAVRVVMADFPFDIVGFDLDGTFLDTLDDLAASVSHALAAAGRPPLTPAQVRPMIGGGAKNMLMKGLEATGGCPPGEFDRLHTLLLSHYEANIAVHTRPFPGALEALDSLKARGVKLAIVTNKLESLAEKLLGALSLRDRFDAVIGGDTMGPGNAKPSGAPITEMIRQCRMQGGGGRAAFVGDSIYDIMAAKNAGIPSIAVSFGFLLQPVETLGAGAVIDDYAELVAALEALALATTSAPT